MEGKCGAGDGVLVVHARTKGKCPWGLIWCLGCLLYREVLVPEKRDRFCFIQRG